MMEETNSMVISEAMKAAHLLNLGGGRPMIINVYLPAEPNVVTHHLARTVYYPTLVAVFFSTHFESVEIHLLDYKMPIY